MTDAKDILARFKIADMLKQGITTIWRDVAAQTDPLQRDIGLDYATSGTPSISGGAMIFDSSGRDAARTYAAGCVSWMTPSETPWFGFKAPRYLRADDRAESYYSECTDIAREILAGTNFYSEVHMLFNDDGIFGTSGMTIKEDDSYGICFSALPVGRYSILENHRREVDTLFQVHRFSPRQAAMEFGEENLPEEIRKALLDPRKCDAESHEFINYIAPRTKRDRFKTNIQNAPFASIWIDRKSSKVVKESGYLESPFVVHRHALFGNCPYGRSPGMEAIFDMRHLNYMQQQLDTLVEKYVTPPVIVPANFEGVIDLRARGITFVPDMSQIPRHWDQSGGNYNIGADRTEFRKRQIDRAFHVELFQALNSVPVGKEMTAAEIRMRQQDRLPTFSPTFNRKAREVLDPVNRLVFAMLLRMGAFPPAPDQIVQRTAEGEAFIPDPQIVYSSRMALQLQSIHNDALLDTMNTAGMMAQFDPSVLDNFNFDEAARSYARNVGLQEANIRPEQDRDAIRQSRADAQAAAEQEASMLEEGETVAKLAR